MTNDEARQHETAIDQALADGALDRAEQWARSYLTVAGPVLADGDPSRAPWFRAAYFAVQVSLARGRLEQALERLVPCRAVNDRLSAELAARVRLLTAEALARLRREPEARSLLDRVPAAQFVGNPVLHLRALRVRLWLGDLARLGRDIAECGRALEARGDATNLALLLCEEGRAREADDDLEGAGRCWERAERLVRGGGEGAIRADVLLQLARVDHLCGRLPSALGRYDEALTAAGQGPHAREVGLRRLLVLLDAGQWQQARSLAPGLLVGSSEELPEEVRPLAAMIQALLDGEAPAGAGDEQQAWAAALRGDVEAARCLYLKALAAERLPERQARLALALGLLALSQAGRDEAESWLRRAEALARERNLPDVLWRALEGRGQAAAELDGDEAAAERLWTEAAVVCESQARQFVHRSDAALYGHQSGVLRRLLLSACRRNDPPRVFHFQELVRGQLLLDLWQGAARPELREFFNRPDVADLESQIAACEEELRRVVAGAEGDRQQEAWLRRRGELRVRHDRLCQEFLRSRSRRQGSALPTLPALEELQRCLGPETLYLAPALVEDELFLLAASRDAPARVIRATSSAAGLPDALAALRGCLDAQIARYRAGLPLGRAHRDELDGLLDALGNGPLGDVLSQALETSPIPRRLVWVPDGLLHGFPLAALRLRDRYLAERVEIVTNFSGSWLVHQARARRWVRFPLRPMLVVTEARDVLPGADREGKGVAACFLRTRELRGPAATRAALRKALAGARAAHFACHAHFDAEHPLAARLILPSGEALHALEWLNGLGDGLALVSLSACRSAEVAPLQGSEVFGLVTALLGGGVCAVMAGLWPVADSEAVPFMGHFYRHRLITDLATALALAQRESLTRADGSPLFWSAFALFGDPSALPAPGPLRRWLARWLQTRHARHFV